MIVNSTLLNSADNSGVKILKCITVKGKPQQSFGKVGHVIIAIARKVIPGSKIKKGTVVKAVIVRTKSGIIRGDGTSLTFSDNAAVVVNEKNEPVGTRVFGPVARELKAKSFVKITSLATEVL